MHQPVLCAKDTQATVFSVVGEDQDHTIASPIARGPGIIQQAPSGSTNMDALPMLSPLAPPVTPGLAPRSLCSLRASQSTAIKGHPSELAPAVLATQPFCRADSKATDGEGATQPCRSFVTHPGRQGLCSLNGDITHTCLLSTL